MMRCVHAGYGSGDNNHAVITPVMAVGTSSGTIYLQDVSTLQASNSSPSTAPLHERRLVLNHHKSQRTTLWA